MAALDCEVHQDPISGRYIVFKGRTFAGAFLIVFVIGFVFYFAETATSPFIYFQC